MFTSSKACQLSKESKLRMLESFNRWMNFSASTELKYMKKRAFLNRAPILDANNNS